MELLHVPGYTELEKLQIAERHLMPKQKRDHGLEEDQLILESDALMSLIRHYTRESGVRNMEQQLAAICRKAAKVLVASADAAPYVVDAEKLKELLGPPKFRYGMAELEDQIGAVTGLAWTEVGGDTLVIEVTIMPGSGKLTLTGQLGDVMKESAQAALSYTRSRVKELGIDPQFHEKNDIHIHIPEGAIPKDGPSAGITMATALISALTNRKISKDVAMTGEITLRGRVLPIGGLKEKSLAAHRAGITKVLMPLDNERDLRDIPESVRANMTFIPVAHMDEVLRHALSEPLNLQTGAASAGQEESGLRKENPAIPSSVSEENEDAPPLGTH
jgi:ATP-dependent Lon protease